MTQPITHLLRRLWHHINIRRRAQFGLLLILMILASVTEIISIGSAIPFLGVLVAPERIIEHKATEPLILALGLTGPTQILLILTIAFGAAALIGGAVRLLLLYASNRLSFSTGAELSLEMYRRTLYQPYIVHCARNSSDLINGISNKTTTVIHIFTTLLALISSGVMLLIVLGALLSIEPLISLTACCGFGLIYLLIIRLTRRQLTVNSEQIARESSNVIKYLQEGLGGIRDVLINGNQPTYCQIYSVADLRLRRAQGSSAFISSSPRFVMEAFGMVLIAGLAYFLTHRTDGIAGAIPVLGGLALAAQRLLPMLQQAYSAWSNIRGAQASLGDALELLDQPLPEDADCTVTQRLPYKHSIGLKQIGFQYTPWSPFILNQVSLTIAKGSRVGFIGTTGSGKSTLLDLVMGLLQPTEGYLEIDGIAVTSSNLRPWQAHLAHVPQSIFLADATIEENIAFGIQKKQIDCELVKRCAKQAQLAEIIESWPLRYQTSVGERGVRLSGGQRQRIGIARALYRQADVIIFDEATSALDNETEKAVMHAIEGLSEDITLLIIAHRLTTLKNCTLIVELGEGGIKRSGTYKEMVDHAQIKS